MKITNLLLWVRENRVSEKLYKKLGFEVVRSDDEHFEANLAAFQFTLVSMRDERGCSPAMVFKGSDGYKLCFWHPD